MHQKDDCIFCQIVQGNAHCHKLHEDELTLTFLDIFPAAPGHLLIITKEHFSDIFEAKAEALARVAFNSVHIADALQRVVKADGLGVYQLNKAAAGQTVFHYHMHLIPQMAGKSIGIHSKVPGDQQHLAALASELRAAISAVN